MKVILINLSFGIILGFLLFAALGGFEGVIESWIR